MKIVHTSDTQIYNWQFGGINPESGLNRRFEDALSCFDFVIDHAIKIKAKYFIHAGDITEHRNPDSVAIEQFSLRVKKIIDAGIRFVLIAGNHDADSAHGCTTSISYLKALGIPNVYIADKSIEVFEFLDGDMPIRFLCLPYFYKSQLNVKTNQDVADFISEEVDTFFAHLPKNKKVLNVSVSHYTTDKMYEGLDVNDPVVPLKTFERFDYNAFGHIHQYHDYYKFGVIGGYCGSPYRVTFGEKEDKFFNVMDFDTHKIEKILIPNRDFVDVLIDASEVGQRGIDIFCVNTLRHMDLEGKFLKITIKSYDRFNVKPIYDHLKDRNIFHFLPVQFEKIRVGSKDRLRYDPSMSDYNVAMAFMKKQEMDENRKKKILAEIKSAIDMKDHVEVEEV